MTEIYGYNSKNILQHILQCISQIAEAKDLDTLLLLLSEMAHRLVPSDRCTIWIYDSERKVLWSKVADGVDRLEMPSTTGVASHALIEGIPFIINDPYNDSRFNHSVDKQTGYHTNNILAIPLKNSDGETVGVFQALNKLDGSEFSEADLNLLLLVTVYIAREIDAAILREEIEATQREIIYTLAETGEMRSKETGNHVKRVAEYCHFIANEIGLTEREQDIIKISSTLHDIGKIAIPDSVLLKPGILNSEERIIMETHSPLGYEMLKHSTRKILEAAATIAGGHHEKWNGTGYPNQLAGDAIPIFARITAVADVYDALASDRCYKKAWDHNRIIELFKEERGNHFDPILTDVFLDNQSVFQGIINEYKDEFPKI